MKSHRIPINFEPSGIRICWLISGLLFFSIIFSSCASLFSPATQQLSDGLSYAIINSEDPSTVKEGAPAYLLMMDALIKNDPENGSILRSASLLNTAYAKIFVKDIKRAGKLTRKGLFLALRAACLKNKTLCNLKEMEFEDFQGAVLTTGYSDIPTLFALGSAWAGWIQTHKKDWNAVAEISRVETIMDRVIQLDPAFNNGEAYLYLGALATLLPSALGGKVEQGRHYFEKAIELSEGKNLMAKVEFARRYARLIFDRQLHDRLLREVINAEPHVEGYVLTNILAQQEAKTLLNSADNYF